MIETYKINDQFENKFCDATGFIVGLSEDNKLLLAKNY
jgi:hypothetical protein